MRFSFVLFLATLSMAAALSVHADSIYRWTDASGQIHFSQTPPAEGSYQRVTPVTSSGSGASNSGLSDFVKQGDAADSAAEKARQAQLQSKAEQAERCAKAREQISSLESRPAHRTYVDGPGGQTARMTDDQHEQMLNDAKKAAAGSCS